MVSSEGRRGNVAPTCESSYTGCMVMRLRPIGQPRKPSRRSGTVAVDMKGWAWDRRPIVRQIGELGADIRSSPQKGWIRVSIFTTNATCSPVHNGCIRVIDDRLTVSSDQPVVSRSDRQWPGVHSQGPLTTYRGEIIQRRSRSLEDTGRPAEKR